MHTISLMGFSWVFLCSILIFQLQTLFSKCSASQIVPQVVRCMQEVRDSLGWCHIMTPWNMEQFSMNSEHDFHQLPFLFPEDWTFNKISEQLPVVSTCFFLFTNKHGEII